MDLAVTQNPATAGFPVAGAPLVYFGRVEPVRAGLITRYLPTYEIDFAKKYASPGDANAFLTGRLALRHILSLLLDVAPGSIRFEYSTEGKPRLPDSDIHFNLSHTENVFSVAVARNRRIGVDIENLHRDIDVTKMMTACFSRIEQELLESSDPALQKQMFIDTWTKKEAVLKAHGSGLSCPMNEFDLSTNSSRRPDGSFVTKMKGTCWKVESRYIFENYRLSVAVEYNSPETAAVTNSYVDFRECGL